MIRLQLGSKESWHPWPLCLHHEHLCEQTNDSYVKLPQYWGGYPISMFNHLDLHPGLLLKMEYSMFQFRHFSCFNMHLFILLINTLKRYSRNVMKFKIKCRELLQKYIQFTFLVKTNGQSVIKSCLFESVVSFNIIWQLILIHMYKNFVF